MSTHLLDAPAQASWGLTAGSPQPVTHDLAYITTAIVNVLFFGVPGAGDRGWVLVDTGIPGSAHRIAEAAAERFGRGARPAAIVLTHGHFDHVGAVRELAETWDVPVYAHELELPYLTGRSSYPPPDPTVGGGAMAALSFAYPRGPIDLGARVRPLPDDGSVPGMPGWQWFHTPGHTAGHVSLFRDVDRALVAGDAFVTTKQESALAVMTQRREIHGPPAYFTPDWFSSRRSVEALAALEPEVAITGHGLPMRGPELREGLRRLARDFDALAVPAHGRYVGRPAVADRTGVVSVPPMDARSKLLLGVGAAAVAGIVLGALTGSRGR
ncbi:MAG TPA: MBL fold metallo-hydrolase [Longimicrobiaceae bacterium]|nr:MBL fold metallo-hydrolase [Longimicrobiaceae bacterium]